MDKAEVLQHIFPKGVVNGRGGDEINGLPKYTVPQNCRILVSTRSPWDDDRIFYLVLYENYETKVAICLRVCKAMDGCGYDEFAVVHQYDVLEGNVSPEAIQDIIVESYAFRIKEYL